MVKIVYLTGGMLSSDTVPDCIGIVIATMLASRFEHLDGQQSSPNNYIQQYVLKETRDVRRLMTNQYWISRVARAVNFFRTSNSAASSSFGT